MKHLTRWSDSSRGTLPLERPRQRRERQIPRRLRGEELHEVRIDEQLLPASFYFVKHADLAQLLEVDGRRLPLGTPAESSVRNFRVRKDSGKTDTTSPAILLQLIKPHQHLPRLAPIRRPQNPRRVQLVDDARRPPIPDPQLPLQE